MSVHGWTASFTTYTHFLGGGGKAQIYLIKPKDSYGEEIMEKKKKKVTPCLFIEGDDSSAAAIKRSVVAFLGCG